MCDYLWTVVARTMWQQAERAVCLSCTSHSSILSCRGVLPSYLGSIWQSGQTLISNQLWIPVWHSEDHESWYILIIKPTSCTVSQIYFDKGLYVFQSDLLSIFRSLNTVYTAVGICHASSVDCLLAKSGWSSILLLRIQCWDSWWWTVDPSETWSTLSK
jgi:hypothetical protein